MKLRILGPALAVSIAALTGCEPAPRTQDQQKADAICKKVYELLEEPKEHLLVAVIDSKLGTVQIENNLNPFNPEDRFKKKNIDAITQIMPNDNSSGCIMYTGGQRSFTIKQKPTASHALAMWQREYLINH